MKKISLVIACMTIISVTALAQTKPQDQGTQKPASPKPHPQLNDKAGQTQTAPLNPAHDKATTPVDAQNPVIDEAETKESKETKKPHPGKPEHQPHNNGANAHGMEMKAKNQEKQKEKKAEHAKKKTKQDEGKEVKKD